MAEFIQVMKEWSRMCLSFKSYGDCPMMDEDGRAHILCSEGGIRSAVPEVQEDVIIKWVVEHPKLKIYPAWRDWLRDLYDNPNMTMTDILESPIDPKIAQQLNITPRRAK